MNGLENAFFHVRYPKRKNAEANTTSKKKRIHTEGEKHICEKENDNDNCVCLSVCGRVHAKNYKMF